MKEAYQQAVMESETGANVKRTETIETADTRSLKERFEKGEVDTRSRGANADAEELEEVFQSGISKKSRSIFLELDANATKPLAPLSPGSAGSGSGKGTDVRRAREVNIFINVISSLLNRRIVQSALSHIWRLW